MVMGIKIDKKQKLMNDQTSIQVLDIDFNEINICPRCHKKTSWIRNEYRLFEDGIGDKKELEGFEFSCVLKCDNCDDEQFVKFQLFTEDYPRLDILTETKKSRKSMEDLDEFVDDKCEHCGRGNSKEPKLILVKKLPEKPNGRSDHHED